MIKARGKAGHVLTLGGAVQILLAGNQGHVICVFNEGEVTAVALPFICVFAEIIQLSEAHLRKMNTSENELLMQTRCGRSFRKNQGAALTGGGAGEC